MQSVVRGAGFGVELGVDSGFAASYLCALGRIDFSEPQGSPREEPQGPLLEKEQDSCLLCRSFR